MPSAPDFQSGYEGWIPFTHSELIFIYFKKKYLNVKFVEYIEKIHILGTILQIHHIDGDCTNNREENLQSLCPNCHAMTDNYGNRNKKSTYTNRRAYRNLNICSIQV